MNDNDWMQIAYLEAVKAAERGEIPVGAVVVRDNEILGKSGNDRNSSGNPLGHAEVLSILQATEKLGDWRLPNATLYVTMEPCPMCAGLILQTRLKRLVYGVPSPREGCAGSVLNLLDYPGMAHHLEVTGKIFSEKISIIMQEFFADNRI